MILMTGGDRIPVEDLDHDQLTWLEQVWIEVMDEIAYETEHPQGEALDILQRPEER